MAPRILLCCLALLALAGCGSEDDAAAPGKPATQLTVRVDPDGDRPEAAREEQISCAQPPEGAACAAAADLRPADFEPVPDDMACTQQFGGPETATVTGTLRGREVDARFSRENGCEIARWDKVSPLLEAAG
jgi:hypothetical protein